MAEGEGAGPGAARADRARWQGGKDLQTVLPESLVPALQEQLLAVRKLHLSDLAAGWGRVLMP